MGMETTTIITMAAEAGTTTATETTTTITTTITTMAAEAGTTTATETTIITTTAVAAGTTTAMETTTITIMAVEAGDGTTTVAGGEAPKGRALRSLPPEDSRPTTGQFSFCLKSSLRCHLLCRTVTTISTQQARIK